MKKLFLSLFTLVLFTSCKEEPHVVLNNQEVVVVFRGFKQVGEIQFNQETFPEMEYLINVEYKGRVYDISKQYFIPEELEYKVGDTLRASVYLYESKKYKILIK